MASRREKLVAGAQPYLDDGEEVRFIASGQTGAPQGPLGALAIVIGKAKQRRVVATERHIYVLAGDFWGTAKTKELIEKHEIGAVPVEYRPSGTLTVAGEKIWLHPFAKGDAEEIEKLGAQRA